MSSSMMRGIPLNNSPLSINTRKNLIIEVDDSGDDSDDNNLHIVEESVEESIEIDDSESDEQAIVSKYFLYKSRFRSVQRIGFGFVFRIRSDIFYNYFDALSTHVFVFFLTASTNS